MGEIILELADSDKVPGFYGQTNYGVGARPGTGTYKVLVCGLPGAAGTITADGAPVRVDDLGSAATLAVAGSELYDMIVEAKNAPGDPEVWACAPTIPTGAFGAATITLAGTWTATGTLKLRVCGKAITWSVSATGTPTSEATALKTYLNTFADLRATVTNSSGVITVTSKTKTVRANLLTIWQDTSELPSGMTSTLAGGTALASGAVPLASGSGVEDVTAIVAAIGSTRYHRIAVAQQDATNLGLWEAKIDADAAALEGRTEHLVVGMTSATQGAVTSIAQTTLDNQRCQVLWAPESETPGHCIAAKFAAIRSIVELQNPNYNYDDYELTGVLPRVDANGTPIQMTHSEKKAALDAGITPVETKSTGAVLITRAITTRTLDANGDIDDATVDLGSAVTPDRMRDDFGTLWALFRTENPRVRADATSDAEVIPAGVATPSLWNQVVVGEMLTRQAQGWITSVATEAKTTPKATFNRTAGRIVSRVPIVATPLHHQMELAVDQVPYSAVTG
jgi:phage tail sheath gpL-like